MIAIIRIPLEDSLTVELARRGTLLKNAGSPAARSAWKAAVRERAGIREHLNRMAPGIQRCMYCADNPGTDIDHFEPIKEWPAGTFEWLNHLLACSFCNSNSKRELFPRGPAGNGLLVDPSRDDPADHLRLILRSGEYRARTPRGTVTIDVFGLNRPDLARGRSFAFEMAKAALCRAHALIRAGRKAEATDCMRALAGQPHASVLREMIRSAAMPGGSVVLGDDVVAALASHEIADLIAGR